MTVLMHAGPLERLQRILSEANPHASSREEFPLTDFLQGELTVIRDKVGHGRVSRISPASEEDVRDLRRWYEANTDQQPTYADDPKWKDWWEQALRKEVDGLSVFKLTLLESEEPLAFLALKDVDDRHFLEMKTLYINGLRINPVLMPREEQERKFSGCGTSLLIFAALQSLSENRDGIGVNSSVGVEGFYRSIGLQEKKNATQDGRSYFTIFGDKRFEFIGHHYREYLRLLAPSFSECAITPP
jgi:hypothetical protein